MRHLGERLHPLLQSPFVSYSLSACSFDGAKHQANTTGTNRLIPNIRANLRTTVSGRGRRRRLVGKCLSKALWVGTDIKSAAKAREYIVLVDVLIVPYHGAYGLVEGLAARGEESIPNEND
jgi:hypothetical protein